MAEDSVVVTLVNQVSEDLGVVQTAAGGDGLPLEDEVFDHGESASEGDVEVEQVLADDSSAHASDDGGNGSMSNITFDVRKRTLIMLWQRTILEEFYKAGMTSASMQLHSLHLAAAEKTGLDSTVIKNWIRNRRRPAAMKSAERLQERINQGDVSLNPQHTFSIVPTQAPPITAMTTNHVPRPVMTSAPVYYPINSSGMISARPPPASHPTPSVRRHMPEPKRTCVDQMSASSHVSSSFTHTSQPISSPTTHQPHSLPSTQPVPHFATAPSLLVKIRVFESGETDFYEVEVPALTYDALIRSCAEELEVDSTQIMKIRKLPNILIRRDRDVQRLHEGQELEVVLKESPSSIVINPIAAAAPPSGFGSSSSGTLPILNLQMPPDPSSLTAVPCNTSLGLHSTSHVNGLH